MEGRKYNPGARLIEFAGIIIEPAGLRSEAADHFGHPIRNSAGLDVWPSTGS